MARKSPDQNADLQYPVEGVDDTRAFLRQRGGTTPDAQNVRAFDPEEDRARGGSRNGLVKRYTYQVVGDYPIQNICHLVTNDVSEPATSKGHFIYGHTTTTPGFKLGSSAGANIASVTEADYAFACSCWDDSGNAYVATVDTVGGLAKVRKLNTSGTVAWTTSVITVSMGSVRNVCGMVVIGNYVFIGVTTAAGFSRIHRIQTSDGAILANWRTTTTNPGLVFSTSAVQALGKIGNLLGVDSRATTTVQQFMIFNSDTAAVVAQPAYGGTAQNNRATVVSDGINYFYVIASVTANIIKCITKGGVIVWSSNVADTPQGLTYNFSTGQLVAVLPSTPSVRVLDLADGTLDDSDDPGSTTTWNWIDCDGSGFFTLYDDGVASNDILGVNSTFTTVWGPTTFDNTTHTGASVNKGATVQATGSGDRQIRVLAVSNGECRRLTETASTSLTLGASWSSDAKLIFSFQLGRDMFFLDGTIYRYYKSTTDAITAWTPTAGAMPVDSLQGKCRIGTVWNRRAVLTGLPRDPGNWFMSAVNAPFNWDYSPATTTATQAVAGNNSDAGLVEDSINGVIAYTDDTLIFLCDHSIWQLTGDPMGGGTLDAISHTIGGAWGKAWAIDPVGQIYFFSTQGCIYKMTPGSVPVPMSEGIKRRLESVDLSANLVTMFWDIRNRGLGVFITPFALNQRGTSFFFEERTSAWWPDYYEDRDHYPYAVHTFDGDDPDDRNVLLGGRDGYVRIYSQAATRDDGNDIESFVLLGPIMGREMPETLLKDLQATLAETSGQVTLEVFSGHSAEQAYNRAIAGTPRAYPPAGEEEIWLAGRNPVSMIYVQGIAMFVKLSSTDRWALERCNMTFQRYDAARRKMSL